MNTPQFDDLIVGAGISGLTLARELAARGRAVLVVEKSRSVGGRMATRRIGDLTFDHGAQFYKARPGFLHDQIWTEKGLVRTWFQTEFEVYKAAPGGVTRLAKDLAQATDIRFCTKIVKISGSEDEYEVMTDDGQALLARRVHLSSPLPQSLELLRHSGLSYADELESIRYAKAIVGLFEMRGAPVKISELKFSGDLGSEILSISNQFSKAVSSEVAFTVIMQPEWSEKHFDRTEDDNLQIMLTGLRDHLRPFLNADFTEANTPRSVGYKKWRYSHPLTKANTDFYEVRPGLFLFGDAFGGPSLIGATRSAMSLALRLARGQVFG